MAKRGRPGQITYKDVEEAALALVAGGKRPTLRALRAGLGDTGSLALIQRHLATWQSQRARAQSSNPFSVGPEDVEALAPADFAALINHLARLEARQNDLPPPDTTLRLNDADGGIDGRQSWTDGPVRTQRFQARTVAWQSKSGRRLAPSDLIREIMQRDGQAIKPRIHDVLAASGAYVVYSAIDLTADQKLSRVHAMQGAARPHLAGVEPNIVIVAADEIAAWAAQDLWSRTFLIRAAGREHTALLATFEEWSELPNLDNAYVWDETRIRIKEQIQAAAGKPGTLFRLNGASGLGKTRLVLEALRPLADAGLGVVYFDARYQGSGLQLLSSIPDWRRLGVGGTLVADDCELDLHQQIAKAIAGTALSVITIDFHPESLVDATLHETTSETIEQIVRGFTPQPAAPTFRRIVEYAQGWPLMAILVLKAIRNESFAIADLTNDELTQRLIGYPQDSTPYGVLSLLALFNHVGYLERAAGEWEELRALFMPEVSHDAFHRIVKDFERKGLIIAIGRYWRVTPPPLALRLTRRWLEDASPQAREWLFTMLSERLTESLGRRFGDVTTETSVALAAELLSPDGRFGTAKGMIGRTNAKIVCSLAGVNPGAAVRALTRTLSSLSDQELLDIDETAGRQQLVWTLEAIAFHAAHFRAAAALLFALARNENGQNSNNASGTFVKFFSLQGSQTEAPPSNRISMLKAMLQHNDDVSYKLVANALSRVLSIHQGYVMLGVESQGGRPALIEWHPTIYKDIFDYASEAVDAALTLSGRGPVAFDLARDVVGDGIPFLVRYRRWDDLERAVAPLRGRAWPKAVDRLKWSIRHDLKENEVEEIERANRILTSLVPTDFAEQVALFITSPPHELEQDSNGTVDRSVENVEIFAQACIDAGRVREAFDIVSTGWEHRLPHAFGQSVAKLTRDRFEVTDDVLAAYSAAAEPRNDLALMSVVGTFGESDPDFRRSLLQRMFDDDRLVQALPAATIWPRADSHDVDLLVRAFKEGRLTAPPRANLLMGNAYRGVDQKRVRALATTFLERGWFSSVVVLLTFGTSERQGYDDIFAEVVLQSKFIREPMDDVHEWSLFEITKRLITESEGFALRLVEDMMTLALSRSSDFGRRRRVADLWPLLLVHDRVWMKFKEQYSALRRDGRWRLLIATQHDSVQIAEDRLAVERRSIGELVAFARDNINDVPAFLAQYALMVDSATDGVLRITPLMMALLENFGDRDDVLHAIEASIHSFLSVGRRANYYAMRMELVNDIPTFGRPRIDVWKDELRADLDAERKRALLRDDEIDKGIF